MKRIISAASVAWAVASLAVVDCGGRTDTGEPGGGSTTGTPNAPAPPTGRSPNATPATTVPSFGDDGGGPPAVTADGGVTVERPDAGAPDGGPVDSGVPGFFDTGLPTVNFFDGGFSFDSGTSYSFDSGTSISFVDGGFVFN